MKTAFATVISAAVLIVPAQSHAGEPGAPFSGAYIGINAGAAWGSSSYTTDPGCPASGVDATFCGAPPDDSAVNGTAVAESGNGKLTPDGFTGGLQAGYNWQVGNIVFGGEADFVAFDLSKSTSAEGTFPFAFLGDAYELTESMSTDWLATIRGRLGATIAPHLLLYVTGGIAFADIAFSSTYSDNAVDATFPGGSGSGRKSGVRTGWALGGGGEWQLDDRWSIKAEYLYVDFGSETVAVPVSNTADFTQTIKVDADLNAHIARVGLNYGF